ncbi:MAG: DUF4125 family protein [Eubacterium sp.]|nr:DUF4125 family protein [Eubacterium sp.]
MDRKAIIKLIINDEWDMFQNVHNIGGRAGCQDEYATFVLMRGSQFASWPDEVIVSYLTDLEDAKSAERNLVMEKYAHMMETTDPMYYSQISSLLPEISENALILAQAITEKYMVWEKEVNIRYPNVRKQGRAATPDSADGRASFKTYLQCELMTYSERTLALLANYILNHPEENLYLKSMEVMAKGYGYASLDEAEKALAGMSSMF